MEWQTLERPGHFGKKRDEIFSKYNEQYGNGNWRLVWKWSGGVILGELARQIYEDAYYMDSFRRGYLWKKLMSEAKDVYDHQESDVESGLDYLIQKGSATHLQDITIRRVLFRRGWHFQGNELIQVRRHNLYWGENLSPGKVPFHVPEQIVVPHLESWWEPNSVEDFFQSNKYLQVIGKKVGFE